MRNGASQMRATLETPIPKIYNHSCWNRLACFASIDAGKARFPVPKVCQNPMFFDRLGLVSSEEHIPQVDENTERAKWLLAALELAVTRPRQARTRS
jgi:hypothetical protein